MAKEFFIIKRVPWEYGDFTGDYLSKNDTFTRSMASIKTFTSINDAYRARQALAENDEQHDFIYSVITM